MSKRIGTLLIVMMLLAPGNLSAASSFKCLKANDVGIDNLLSPRPVQGELKSLLLKCGLLKNVETVRYFHEKTFDRGTLIGLGDGCIRWVFYLNLADLLSMVSNQACPR